LIQEFLREVELFRALDDEELAQVLMVGRVRRFPAEARVLSEGSPGGQLMVVHQGQVRVSKQIPGFGEEALAILGPGEFVGEVSFLDGGPVSADVIAHRDCELWVIPHAEVEALMLRAPGLAAKFLWAFARTLATRLRQTDARLASLVSLASRR
jgi:CRP-like cAMP-binding protein